MSKYYLFNGVKLPELPEWDKETYPYAIIVRMEIFGEFWLYVTENPLSVFYSVKHGYDVVSTTVKSNYLHYRCNIDSDTWVSYPSYDDSYFDADESHAGIPGLTVWVNRDVMNADDGSLFMKASEPVLFVKLDLRSWLTGYTLGLAGKPIPICVKREPVAYLYNGVRLPKFPDYYGTLTEHPLKDYRYVFVNTHPNSKGEYEAMLATVPFFAVLNDYGFNDRYGIHSDVPKDGFVSHVYLYYDPGQNRWKPGGINTNVPYDRAYPLCSWVLLDEMSNPAVWFNHDVYDEPGKTVIFEKSPDPVPVYE